METFTCADAREAIERMSRSGAVLLTSSLRSHVDACRACWRLVVDARWRVAEQSDDVRELREFLGGGFQAGVDPSWALADEWNSQPRDSQAAVEHFYRTTPWYVYNLVLWKASGQRPNYSARAKGLIQQHRITSVLDFGAGVGTDALQFAAGGLRTAVVELNELAAAFLMWRAQRRGIALRRLPIGGDKPREVFELLWAVDVIEHLWNPLDTLQPYLSASRLLIYDSEHKGQSSGRQPFHFNHDEDALDRAWMELGLEVDLAGSQTADMRVFVRPPH
jgi:hypothetical protein